MRLGLRFAVAAAVLLAFVGVGAFARYADKPKFTVAEVMEKAHDMDDGILKKVAGGKASDAEKKELVELYTALTQNKPNKGEEKSWKMKTEALLVAAKSAEAGKEGASKALQTAANCKACHTAHK